MAKFDEIPNADSAYSIDLSKPEGMSSFWNLFSKNNKKEDVNGNKNNDKAKLKLNGFALKLLKLKGIDLTNIDSFQPSDLHSSKQNPKIMFINPKNVNLNKKELLKENMLNALLANNNLKDVPDFELKGTSPGADPIQTKSGLIKSSVTYLRSKKPKNCTLTDKKALHPTGKDDKTYKILPSAVQNCSLSESDVIKSSPETKTKKRRKKAVIVPVYVGKRKTNDSNNVEEYFLNIHGHNETLDVPSLISKIKTMETHLSNLKSKSKGNKSFQRDAETLISANKAESQPTKQNNNHVKTYISSRKPKENHQQYTFSPKDCPGEDRKNKNDKTNLKDQNLVDILNYPDVLIKNHNLIIPGDLSEESLFQANPCAGCDTIINLFNVLSNKGNQPKNESKENIQENHQTLNFDTEKLEKVDNFLPGLSDCVKETNEIITSANNADTVNVCDFQECSPISSSGRNLESNNREKIGSGFRNIFSLPVNKNTLKLFNNNQSCEKKKNIYSYSLKADVIKSHDKIVEKQSVFAKGSGEKQTNHIPQENKTSKQNLKSNVSQTTIDNENIEIKTDSKQFSKESLVMKNLKDSKFSESKLNEINPKTENKANTHSSSSALAQKEDIRPNSCHEISVDTSMGHNIRNVNTTDNLNISHEQCIMMGAPEQPQKLLKKTTISCPVKLPNQKVNITILFDGNSREGRQIQRDTSPRVNSRTLIPIGDVQSSSLNLTKEQTILEKEQNKEEQNVHIEGEPTAVNCLSVVNSTLSNKSKISPHKSRTNQKLTMLKQNGKTELIDLISKPTYLTKEQREIFDKDVLRVNHNEKSINFNCFKYTQQHKKPFLDLKHRLGFIKVLSQSSFNGQETNSKSQCEQNTSVNDKTISHPFGLCNSGSPFHIEGFNNKNRSKTKIIHLHEPFNINDVNQNDQQYFKTQVVKNDLRGENSDNNNLKKNILHSEEPLVEQTESNTPTSKYNEEYEKYKNENRNRKIGTYEEHDQFFKVNDLSGMNKCACNRPKFVVDTSIKDSELLENLHLNCSMINEIVYKPIINIQPDFDKIKKTEINSNFCDEKSIIPEKADFNITESQLNNSSEELESICLRMSNSFLRDDFGVEISSYHENISIQQNNAQSKHVLNSKHLLNGSKEENEVGNHGSLLSKSITKVTCRNAIKHISSRNEFNETENNIVQNIKEIIEYRTREEKLCFHCYAAGCLAIPNNNWSEDP